jgi:hypothetical protein
MTGKLVVVVVLATLSVAPASAAPSAVDARAIASCLKMAEENGAFGGQCIGAVADPCIATVKDTASYQDGSKTCAAREFAVWDELLRIALSRMKAGGKEVVAAVAAAQKTWSQSLGRLCPLFDNLDPGMSLGGAAYCRLQETARRVLMLRRLADAVNPH